MQTTRRTLLAAATAAALTLGLAGGASAEDTIKIGLLATLEGPFTVMGQDSVRGATLALQQHDNMAGGKKLQIIQGSSNASPDSAIAAARKLVEQDGVQILVGPLSGSEGIAVKEYAKTQPNVTFVNGSSAAQETTLDNPAPNFFRFSTDGVQWQAGLGEYIYNDKGYKTLAVVAEDYSFPYALIMGLMGDYCSAGGKVVEKFFVPIGTKDYSTIIAGLPDDIDAIYVALGGADAVNFLSQYQQAGGDKPMVAGSITVDQTVLGSKGQQRDYIVGTPTAGPIADSWDDPRWKEFVQAYKSGFADGFPSPSLFAHAYYVNMSAVLEALDEVNGDLSDGQKKFREALASLELQTPTGVVKLDENRQAVADIFLTEVAVSDDGTLYNKVVKVIPGVTQTLGQPREQFLASGFASRNNPECR